MTSVLGSSGVHSNYFNSDNHVYNKIHQWSQSCLKDDKPCREAGERVKFAIAHLQDSRSAIHMLNLSGHSIKSLPDLSVMRMLQGITTLDLSFNVLSDKELEKIACITSLDTLILTGNPVVKIPELVISSQNRLLALEANNCELVEFPYPIINESSLVELDLSYNPIPSLPEDIGVRMFGLTKLDIRGTQIDFLPDSLKRIKRLNILL